MWHKRIPLNTVKSELQVATLNVSKSTNIFADSAFFITDNCEQCKINKNCIFKTDELLYKLSKIKTILLTLIKDMSPSTPDEEFINNLHNICYQNSNTLIFYLQSVMFKLMHSSLNCNKDGYSQIPIFFSQNSENYLSFDIKHRTVQIKL